MSTIKWKTKTLSHPIQYRNYTIVIHKRANTFHALIANQWRHLAYKTENVYTEDKALKDAEDWIDTAQAFLN